MAILHMDTDAVRALAGEMERACEQIQSQVQSAARSALSADWIGPSRDQFAEEVTRVSDGLMRQADDIFNLSQRVKNEVSEWETAAAQLGADGTGVGNLIRLNREPLERVMGGGVVLPAAGAVLGVSTMTFAEASPNASPVTLGSGSYAARISAQVDARYDAQLQKYQEDLSHYQNSKALFENSRQSDLALLKKLDDELNDLKTRDGSVQDFLQDGFGNILGHPAKYEEMRMQTLDRIAFNEQKIAEMDGNIARTQQQIQTTMGERTAAIDAAMKTPNTSYAVSPANANPVAEKGWCMKYVSDFRGQPPHPGGIPRSGSASDLVTKPDYADMRYKVPANTGDLRDQVVPGTVVAYDKGQQGADGTYGHAAVITEVGKDYVIVKESSWGSNPPGSDRKIPLSKLSELTLIGYDSIPRN